MINITLVLLGGGRLAFTCTKDSALFGQVSTLVNRLSDGQNSSSQILQMQIDSGQATRGLAISTANVLAVETEPPQTFTVNTDPAMARTAPYIRIPDFLPESERQGLLTYFQSRQDEFSNSTVVLEGSKNTHNEAVRKSVVIRNADSLPAFFERELREIIPGVMEVLEMAPAEDYDLEVQLTAHNDGAFYKMHQDNNTKSTTSRQLTFVYYFNQEPKSFSGGAIRLFDTMQDTDHAAESYVDIEPDNNSLILFPSHVPHEVLEIACPSRKFEHSRFTLNGWVRISKIAQ